MKDHIHIVWKIKDPHVIKNVINSFKTFTGKGIIRYLKEQNADYLSYNFAISRQDRLHKFWKIKTAYLRLSHSDIIKQKINYTHLNPTKGQYKVVNRPELYVDSSSNSYRCSEPEFSFLKLYAFY